MNIDVSEILAALGGGASAVLIVVSLVANAAQWRRNQATQESRIADQKEHTSQILEALRSVDRAIDFVEGRRG